EVHHGRALAGFGRCGTGARRSVPELPGTGGLARGARFLDGVAHFLRAAPRDIAVPRAQRDDRTAVALLAVLHDLDLHDVVDGEVQEDAAARFVGDDAHAFLVAGVGGEIVLHDGDFFQDEMGHGPAYTHCGRAPVTLSRSPRRSLTA